MKTIFRTMFLAGAVVLAAGCGNNGKKEAAQTEAVVENVAPSVAVQQVFVREVPQMATYTSTVQAYVKNNIAPQMAGRITKINVEIGDFVKAGHNFADIIRTPNDDLAVTAFVDGTQKLQNCQTFPQGTAAYAQRFCQIPFRGQFLPNLDLTGLHGVDQCLRHQLRKLLGAMLNLLQGHDASSPLVRHIHCVGSLGRV